MTLVVLAVPTTSYAVDWSTIKGKELVLFYPARLSWEMLLTQSEHSGADKFREGKDCRQCHEGEERASGMLLVADPSVDSAPIKDKPGFLEATMKTAVDQSSLHIRLEFDPGDQPNAAMDDAFETKVAVMFDDGNVAEAARAGCWATCHDNLAKMPSGNSGEVTKYLTRSRSGMTRQGSNTVKSAAELEQIRNDGGYLEYWQARLNRSAEPDVIDGFILDSRTENETPLVTAQSTFENGRWSVTFSRPLAGTGLHKSFKAGQTYTFGVSIHAGYAAQRYHYVSLEKTLVLGDGSADLVALRH